MDNSGWLIVRTDTSENAIESANTVFAISNGYMSLRGNLLEYRKGSYPTTILAGVFDLADMVAFIRPTKYERRYLDEEYFDTATPSPSVANLPNPLFVRVFIDGREISFHRGKVTGFRQGYGLSSGVYSYEYTYEDTQGKSTRIRMSRLCDMTNVHRAVMRYSITPLNYSGTVTVQSGIDGTVRSNLQKDRQFEVMESEAGGGRCYLHARTIARGIDVNLASANIYSSSPALHDVVEDERVYETAEFDAKKGQEIVLEKHIAVSSSEDGRYGVTCDVRDELEKSAASGYEGVAADQRQFWRNMWEQADVVIEGDNLAQTYLRFCLFHLMSAAPRHTDKLSVPCKLLTGEHYQGSVFYDTDLYTEPFYLFTFPHIARSCVNYRYLGLGPGKEIAKDLGYRGAKFAWQAGPYGEEVLGRWWQFTHTNIHIDGDVAHSLMQYYLATGDTAYMTERGIDILVETSRFYASRADYDAAHDRYDLKDVAGPDEGHCESTNNFYTNLFGNKTLLWTVNTLDSIRRDSPSDYDAVVKRLAIAEDEPQLWRKVAQGLTFYFDPETKVYEQYEGFYKLLPPPADLLEGRTAWFVTVFPYQALNQPDVVMGMVLHPEDFPEAVRRANWEFYKDKSMNFSSMSFVINSMMAKDVGDMDYAYKQFLISAGEDIDEDLTGRRDTADGIHGTASGGAWMAAVMGFGGVFLSESGLVVNPRLPTQWKSLKFRIVFRGETLHFDIDHSHVKITAENKKGIEVDAVVAGRPVRLASGQTYEIGVLGA